MPTPSSVVTALPASGIRRMMAKASAMSDVARLDVGEPQFPTPPHIVEAACAAARQGMTRYAPSGGLKSTREAIAAAITAAGTPVTWENVVVTVGAVGALISAVRAVVDPGDEVLVPDPGWPNYLSLTQVSGARPRRYALDAGHGFAPTREALEAVVTPRTRAVLINTPGNPTGAVFSEEAIEGVLAFARDHDLYVISDEVYGKIVYDRPFVSAWGHDEDDRVIVANSVSKTYSMTGWRLGWALAEPAVAALIAKLQEAYISCSPTISQVAVEAALAGDQSCVAEFREAYRGNLDDRRRGARAAGHRLRPLGRDLLPLGARRLRGLVGVRRSPAGRASRGGRSRRGVRRAGQGPRAPQPRFAGGPGEARRSRRWASSGGRWRWQMRLLVRGGTVVSPDGRREADVVCDGERIEAVVEPGEATAADEVIDATGLLVFPGFHRPSHPPAGPGRHPQGGLRPRQPRGCRRRRDHAARHAQRGAAGDRRRLVSAPGRRSTAPSPTSTSDCGASRWASPTSTTWPGSSPRAPWRSSCSGATRSTRSRSASSTTPPIARRRTSSRRRARARSTRSSVPWPPPAARSPLTARTATSWRWRSGGSATPRRSTPSSPWLVRTLPSRARSPSASSSPGPPAATSTSVTSAPRARRISYGSRSATACPSRPRHVRTISSSWPPIAQVATRR